MHSSAVKYVVTIFMLSIALVAAATFGIWAFMSRGDYKDNSDKKVAAAVKVASADAAKVQQAKDIEANKQPFKTYNGSLTYGGVTFNYPRTWSGVVDTSDTNEPINGYFYPDIVPGIQSNATMALRVELLNQDYPSVVQQFESSIAGGDLKASAYVPPKMAGVTNISPGLRLDGLIDQNKQGSLVIIKVRDKTLEISTQSKDFQSDYDGTVLPSLSFVP